MSVLKQLMSHGRPVFRAASLRCYNAKPEDVSKKMSSSTSEVGLSDSCIKQLKQLISGNKFLRVAVEGGGCSGFQYKFDMDDQIHSDDRIFEKEGAKVVIDETSLEYLKGSVIDYHEELIRSAFRVLSNPKADHGCSCGASFSVKID